MLFAVRCCKTEPPKGLRLCFKPSRVKPVKKKREEKATLVIPVIPQTDTKSKEKRSSNSQLRTNDSLDGREIQEKKDSRDGCKKQLRSVEGSDSLLAYSYYRFPSVFARSLVSRSTGRSSKKRKKPSFLRIGFAFDLHPRARFQRYTSAETSPGNKQPKRLLHR